MIEALMKDDEGAEVRFSKADECLADASVARAWYAAPVVWCIDFFELDSELSSFR